MAEPTTADIINRARAALQEAQDRAFAQSVLAGAPDWARTGRPPPAADLISAGFDGRWSDELALARSGYIRRFGFSIVCEEAVAALLGLSPLVEVGAGAGYWSAVLAAAGADVVATDANLQPIGYSFTAGAAFPTSELPALEAVARHPDRDVFCSWPSRGEGWLTPALEAMAPGRRAALILEPRGGKTGDDSLYQLLDDRFTRTADIELPRFPENQDRLAIYMRA